MSLEIKLVLFQTKFRRPLNLLELKARIKGAITPKPCTMEQFVNVLQPHDPLLLIHVWVPERGIRNQRAN